MGAARGATGQSVTRRLRWLLAGAMGLLLLVLAGYLVVGRLHRPDYLKGLERKLGADIQQETNSFTYDQSFKGKKIYTIHAAKEVQRRDGGIALHDVGIVLYGPNGEPADRIHGADFEYDQKRQVLTAKGEVYIDLVPPAAKNDEGERIKPLRPQEEGRLVHVKTIGLVFDREAQTASSDGPVEFRAGGYAGSAVGATYDARNGSVVLKSAVRISGMRKDRPVVVTASQAEMDRETSVVFLDRARYALAGGEGSDPEIETASADHAVIHTEADGTPQRVDAEGRVTLAAAQRGSVVCDRLNLELGPQGLARAAHLLGAVQYTNAMGPRRENGRADDAKIAFDGEGRPLHAAFTGGVSFLEQGPAATRRINAETVQIALAGGGKTPSILTGAEAFGAGGARLRLVDEYAGGRSSTDIQADRLTGRFAKSGRTSELQGLDGVGHSLVERVATNSVGLQTAKDTSTGDVLHVEFRQGERRRSELTRAQQTGRVATVHEASAKNGNGPPQVEHGRADDEVYEVPANLVHLRGAVELQDETSAIFAERVDVDRGNGDATAEGDVKVTYAEAPAAKSSGSTGFASAPPARGEPVHVLAARAVVHKASGLAEFFGDARAKARMWQGASQVEAPVLDFYRGEKRLVAHGDGASGEAAVHAVLVSDAPADAPAEGAKAKKGSSGPVRVMSREMIYTDATRTVLFTGGVRLADAAGGVSSQELIAFLTPAAANAGTPFGSSGSTAFLGGKLDRLVATGQVVVDQPGRRGTGERLVYTARDQYFVLTGTKAAPPKVVDDLQGSTTGAALRFHSGDNSVDVVGGLDAKTGGRVHTQTRMRQ